MTDTTDMAVGDNTAAVASPDTALTPAFVPDPDGEAGPERQAEHLGWGYALSTDPVRRDDAAEAVELLVAAYHDTAKPAPEVKAHVLAALSAATMALIPAVGQAGDKVVVRIGGRATPGHAIVPGPDESLTVTVSVVDVPDVPEVEEDPSAPIVVEGGSYSQVE